MRRAIQALALLALTFPPLAACSTDALVGAGRSGNSSAQGGSAGNAAVAQGGDVTAAPGDGGAAGNDGGVKPIKDPPFGGSCLKPDRCTDEWDSLFGTATLATLCQSENGVFSAGHCDQTGWTKKCTETMEDAVYVSYLPTDGVCDGIEEPL